MKIAIVPAFLFSLTVSCSAGAWEGEKLKVCADPNNPPFSDEKEQGFENKIAELLAKSVGKKIEYTWFPQRMGFIRNTLKAQIPDSEEFRCDVIMGLPTGAEMAATTKPYYRSTYALVFQKGHGWDDIRSAADLDSLDPARKAKLRIAMYDGSPATTWLLKHQLIERGVPIRSMGGDISVNTSQGLEKEFKDGHINMAIIWGPIAGYLETRAGKAGSSFVTIPIKSEEGVKFDFPMSMAVRIPDKARKESLNAFIDENQATITAILRKFRVPLVDEKGALIAE